MDQPVGIGRDPLKIGRPGVDQGGRSKGERPQYDGQAESPSPLFFVFFHVFFLLRAQSAVVVEITSFLLQVLQEGEGKVKFATKRRDSDWKKKELILTDWEGKNICGV